MNANTNTFRALSCTALFAAASAVSNANLTFTQTVDLWFENKYTWNAQVESITCVHNLDPVGTTKSVWARVVQKNGSQAGTAVFCTTMTKTANGITDTWAVNVPAGMICDKDFWDATVLCVEIVKCGRNNRLAHLSLPSPFGQVVMENLPGGDLDLNPNFRYMSLDPIGFDTDAVELAGFDMAVYGYEDPFSGQLIILNHLDPIAFSTFIIDEFDAFGSGNFFFPEQMRLIGVRFSDIPLKSPTWNQVANQSTGLNTFNWPQLPPPGPFKLFEFLQTDQGEFLIEDYQYLSPGWIPLCPADFNNDGELDFLDISDFLMLYTAMDPAADFNGDGMFDFLDISDFLLAYSNGCLSKK